MITIDAKGDACPIPVIKTKKAIDGLQGGGTIEVFVDNEIAVQNVTKMAVNAGGAVKSERLGDKEFLVEIRISGKESDGGAAQTGEDSAEVITCSAETRSADKRSADKRRNTVVVISSDKMGNGNDQLGSVLMKGFLFALTQLEELPGTILFYNGGAVLTSEGSESLEDLRSLEAQGVEIMTCGTCLDYYGLKEKLAVGSVTNMYSIVETMQKADHILRP